MAQKTYCVNPKCAKPIEYAYEKPKFCPFCGNSLTAILARPIPAYNPYTSPAPASRPEPSRASRQFSQPSPGLSSVQRRMEARRNRGTDDDDSEDYDDDDYEESSAFIDFNNFQFKATVRVPQEPKMTLGDFVNKEDKK
jgi:hypothetical protein